MLRGMSSGAAEPVPARGAGGARRLSLADGAVAGVTVADIVVLDEEPPLVLVRTAGEASGDRLVSLHAALTEEPWFRPGLRLALDHSALAVGRFRTDDARKAGARLDELRRRLGPGGAVALVSEAPAMYGCLRMGTAYDELSLGEAHAERRAVTPVRAFDSLAAALHWLRAGAPSG